MFDYHKPPKKRIPWAMKLVMKINCRNIIFKFNIVYFYKKDSFLCSYILGYLKCIFRQVVNLQIILLFNHKSLQFIYNLNTLQFFITLAQGKRHLASLQFIGDHMQICLNYSCHFTFTMYIIIKRRKKLIHSTCRMKLIYGETSLNFSIKREMSRTTWSPKWPRRESTVQNPHQNVRSALLSRMLVRILQCAYQTI